MPALKPGLADDAARALAYHDRSKHHPGRYAPSLGFLDWATQPSPWLRYAGAQALPLPLAGQPGDTPPLFARGSLTPPPLPLDLRLVGRLFELSLAITAWKSSGSATWALRANPSSGNLHPTEAYAVLPALDGLGAAGVYHYRSEDHALEQRCALPEAAVAGLGPDALLVGLTSIHWREAWKYGERAFRYCQHDVGHALAGLAYAAAALGWRLQVLDGMADADLRTLLGLAAADAVDDVLVQQGLEDGTAPPEGEEPACVCLLTPTSVAAAVVDLGVLVRAAAQATWLGKPEPLGEPHVTWPALDEVAAATRCPGSPVPMKVASGLELSSWPPLPDRPSPPLDVVVRQRRSALGFDGATAMPAELFFDLLDRTLPRPDAPPFAAWPWPAEMHAVLFAHRIKGLAPGLYVLVRNPGHLEALQRDWRPDLLWQKATVAPEHLPLYLLAEADLRMFAQNASCFQELAADAAFTVAMVARTGPVVREAPWRYRRLFWECGLWGQVAYLTAEAAGLRATGIGCFFDDQVLRLLGLVTGAEGGDWQDLYHLAVGGAVEDGRVTTLAAYPERG